MTEQKSALARFFVACWKAEALKAPVMTYPRVVLAAYDMPAPDGMDVSLC
jgi:hypothetical protein